MNLLDYGIVLLYFVMMIWLGFKFKKSEKNTEYFLGGKGFGWFSLCMSTMATQLSVISFVSAPAFVGLRAGGGMQWLTFEFGVPLAMIILIAFIAPALYKSSVVSAYAFLEKRFNSSSRLLLSSVFLISRAFATSVTVYAVSLILMSILQLSFMQTILIISLVTILYSLEGGMKAIVYSEVAQMIIKVLGIFIIIYYGLKEIGGWDTFIQNVDTKRLEVLRFRNTGFDNQEFGFWPMLFGGIFLYCAYYGTDQSQVQRILSAKDEKTVKKLLLFNGLFRFPITLSYCFGGLILGTLVSLNGDFASKIPIEKPDLMIPVFITNYLPHGVIGVIIVAIIAAAMSAYSSNINSLAAVTMEDFLSKKMEIPVNKYVTYSKVAALVWGLITLVLAFFMGDIAKTVIEAINKIGSVFYGPVVCMFLLAIFTKNIQAKSANTGVVFGVVLNLILWIFFKNIFWFWWNVIGAVTTFLVAIFCHYFVYKTDSVQNTYVVANPTFKKAIWTKETAILFFYFVLIFSFCYFLTSLV